MISAERSTQMLTPSWGRVYTSRACSIAMRASGAWRLPTCLCWSPERERMNPSYSGHSSLMPASLSCGLRRAAVLLHGVRGGRLAHPAPGLIRRAPRLEALAVAGSVPCEHRMKLVPVDRADQIMLRGRIEAQRAVGNREPQELRLRHRDIDEFLAQFVVAEALDLPTHRLGGVPGVGIARPEHHDRGPPPAVERILRHRPLRAAPLRQRQHDLEPLALVKALLLADAHHGTRVRAIGAAADGDLVHDRRAIDQPADRAHVRPGECRVVEYARVLGGAGQQLLENLRPRDAERLRGAGQVNPVA